MSKNIGMNRDRTGLESYVRHILPSAPYNIGITYIMGYTMPEPSCTEKIYSEDYTDYLIEYFEADQSINIEDRECMNIVAQRYGVFFRAGGEYRPRKRGETCSIPHCYGLLSSDQVLESTGVARVQRQPGLDLYGQGVMVGFVDTGERVIILSSWQERSKYRGFRLLSSYRKCKINSHFDVGWARVTNRKLFAAFI